MKIFTDIQIKEIDRYTIENEPVSSVDLMERAAGKVFSWISGRFGRSHKFIIVAGPGNNGGDGLALARMLSVSGYNAEVYYVSFTDDVSDDWKINRKRLIELKIVPFHTVTDPEQFPESGSGDIIIDAIFGSGLNRKVKGLPEEIIKRINHSPCTRISIDIPSGLFPEDNSANAGDSIVMADYTLTFQFPKLAFMFADNYCYTGEWHILDINLHPAAIRNITTQYYYTENRDIEVLLKKRKRFDHKGCYGHGLLIAGSGDKTGAAILAAKGALRAGIGLITCHLPAKRINALISALPEAMVQCDKNENFITEVNNFNNFTAVGVGPGIGTDSKTASMLSSLLENCSKPLVIDADALNIIATHKELKRIIPAHAVLTPHPKEFERIAGKSDNGYTRLKKQITFSKEHNCIVVLKGAYTSITMPDGRVFFNSTGNPGMATAGSGDVLTGIILSLLAQGYHPEDAALTGVYLHGLAGDIAAEKYGMESLIAGDITNNISEAFRNIREQTDEIRI
ncbi:MAG: NAD(P)H-hydrate dehydratase [Bacteroidales bacterium]